LYLWFRNSSEKFQSPERSEKCRANMLAILRLANVISLFCGFAIARICFTGLSPQKRLILDQILYEGVAGWMVEVKELEASFLFFLSSNLNLTLLRL